MIAPKPRSASGPRLGELLIDAGLLDPDQLQRALEESKQTKETLGMVLLKRGIITEEQLGKVLAHQAGTQYVRIGDYTLDPALVDLLSIDLIARHKVLPLSGQGGTIELAMVHPNDVRVLDEIRMITGLRPRPRVTTSQEFEDVLKVLLANNKGEVTETIASLRKEAEVEAPVSNRTPDSPDVGDQPVVRLVNGILSDAISQGASDIHFESHEHIVCARLRIDGVMAEAVQIPKTLEAQVMSRLKVMAGADIAERRKPQDGRARITVGGRPFDLRVNVMPTLWGEKAVIRVLRPTMLVGGFDHLGMAESSLRMVRELIDSPHGIVLVTGPTGSGKTTTLYSALYELNSPDRNILTVEDPVEFPLQGITQTQVAPKAGWTFDGAIRAMLRQDPDVVMVGEIRDAQTLEAAVFAAMTGHLVLSTLHTNDAASTTDRLLEMGLPAYLLTSALQGVIAQRLLRKLCVHCREPCEQPAGSVPTVLADAQLYRPGGCARCRKSGYGGRVGIYEIVLMTHPIQELIISGAPGYRVREEASRQGMARMEDDALAKVKQGITTPAEVARTLGPRWLDNICHPSTTAP